MKRNKQGRSSARSLSPYRFFFPSPPRRHTNHRHHGPARHLPPPPLVRDQVEQSSQSQDAGCVVLDCGDGGVCVRALRRSPGSHAVRTRASTTLVLCDAGAGEAGHAERLGKRHAPPLAPGLPTRDSRPPRSACFRPPAGPAAPPARTGTRLRVPGHDGQRELSSGAGAGRVFFARFRAERSGRRLRRRCMCRARHRRLNALRSPPSPTLSPATPGLSGAWQHKTRRENPTTLTPIHPPRPLSSQAAASSSSTCARSRPPPSAA